MTGQPAPLRVRLRVQPFEFMMGIYAVATAVMSWFGIGPVSASMHAMLPHGLPEMLALIHGASGLMIVAGILSGRLRWEAGGLCVLISGAFVRLAVIAAGGVPSDTVGLAAFHLAMILAALGRLHAVFTDEVTITIRAREP